MGALDRVAKTLLRHEQGVYSPGEFFSHISETIYRADRDEDPELADAALLLIQSTLLDVETYRFLAHVTFRAISTRRAFGDQKRTLAILQSAIFGYLHSTSDSLERAARLGATPVQWTKLDWLTTVVDAGPDDDTRLALLPELLPALQHHFADAGAFAIAIEPYLETKTPEAARLVAVGYRTLRLSPGKMHKMREHLIARRDALGVSDAFSLGQRFSIECFDDLAADFMRAVVDAGLDNEKLPVAAIVFWMAGKRDESRPLAREFEAASQGWGTQAAESLLHYIEGHDSTAEERLQNLAFPESEGFLKRPATVGALVGRLAFVRMRAYEELENWDDAAREAYAVVKCHGYRDYDLHMQAADGEFDVRLVERLAVTPDELAEAHRLIFAHPLDEVPHWFVMEGKLVRPV